MIHIYGIFSELHHLCPWHIQGCISSNIDDNDILRSEEAAQSRTLVTRVRSVKEEKEEEVEKVVMAVMADTRNSDNNNVSVTSL